MVQNIYKFGCKKDVLYTCSIWSLGKLHCILKSRCYSECLCFVLWILAISPIGYTIVIMINLWWFVWMRYEGISLMLSGSKSLGDILCLQAYIKFIQSRVWLNIAYISFLNYATWNEMYVLWQKCLHLNVWLWNALKMCSWNLMGDKSLCLDKLK